MAPHRALETHDIIYHILGCFGPCADANRSNFDCSRLLEVDSGKQSRTLAYCARTSKAFSEPALRLLWRELPSLLPLLSIGLDMIKAKNTSSETRVYTLDDDDTDHGNDGLWVRTLIHHMPWKTSTDMHLLVFLRGPYGGRAATFRSICCSRSTHVGAHRSHSLLSPLPTQSRPEPATASDGRRDQVQVLTSSRHDSTISCGS